MKAIKKYKLTLIFLAFIVVAIIAMVKPEYAENAARAFMLLIVGI